MSAYLIFAICLTVVYIIYFITLMYLDLYGKKKDSHTNVETFDVAPMVEEEESIVVTESERGFNVGGNDYEMSMPAPVTADDAEDSDPLTGTQRRDSQEEAKARMMEKLEPIIPIHSDSYERDEFIAKAAECHGIIAPKPQRPVDMKWLPVKDNKPLDNM